MNGKIKEIFCKIIKEITNVLNLSVFNYNKKHQITKRSMIYAI